MESAGKAWAVYGREIEATVAKQSSLGFDDEALMQTFSLFVRQSKDVGQALRENNIAMDVDARNGASGMELLAQLERDFGGSAKAAANDGATAMPILRSAPACPSAALFTICAACSRLMNRARATTWIDRRQRLAVRARAAARAGQPH